MISIDTCVASFHLPSFTWTGNVTMKYVNGVIFNVDEKQEVVFYIGSNRVNSSLLYKVILALKWHDRAMLKS